MLTIPKCWHIIHFLGKHRILIIINVGVAPRLFHINSLTCEFSAGTGKLCLCRWAWIYVQSAHNGRESTRCVLAHFPVLDDKTRVGDIIISICFKISLIGLCGGANSLPGTEVKTYSWQSPPPHRTSSYLDVGNSLDALAHTPAPLLQGLVIFPLGARTFTHKPTFLRCACVPSDTIGPFHKTNLAVKRKTLQSLLKRLSNISAHLGIA